MINRPMSRGGRPGTGGQRSMMVSSAGRPGTGRLGTGQTPSTPGQTAGYGSSLNTEVNVTDRPVTQQGMMGMRIATAGPGRQIQDASYYIGRLHQKTSEIKNEVDRMSQSMERRAKEDSQVSAYERKYEELMENVRGLEGALADFNLATDNLRSRTDPDDIRAARTELEARNGKEAEEVDSLFLTRQEKETRVVSLENEIHNIALKQEALINELAPMKLQQYQALSHENHALEQILHPQIQQVDMLTEQIGVKEEMLSNDRFRNQFSKLEKQVSRLRAERDSAAEDCEASKMDPEEARGMMLAKVKDGKSQMAAIEDTVKDGRQELLDLQKAIKELNIDLKEKGERGNSSGQQKIELLHQRDAEMTHYLDAFPSSHGREKAQQVETQRTIVALLEYLSTEVSRPEDDFPSMEKEDDMNADLTFKERQLESSTMTHERLEQELKKRQGELEKINGLDEKIVLEKSALTEKMEVMNLDLQGFEQLELLRDTAENTKQV